MTKGKPSKGKKSAKAAAARPPEQFLELSELLNYVGQVIARGVPGAVWVRAEIASLTDRRHLYMDLVEVGAQGEVAKCRATLWARERFGLEAKFRAATGGPLAAGVKVLLYCTAEFHEQYGFALQVLDISPEFTLGDSAARLEAMRETLVLEGSYGLNRLLPAPEDYARVAVISPQEAAGLGDFRRETDVLEAAGIVQFIYLEATFQGRDAAASLLRAVAQARALHEHAALDALVVIRGGGASTDLAWLNNLEVARALATFPAPVITGLGHARDDTLPDEVAHTRTDTPSKAAALIVQTVLAATAQIQEDTRSIRQYAAQVLGEAGAGSQGQFERIRRSSQRQTELARAGIDALMRQALGLTPERTLERGYALVRGSGGQVLTRAAQVSPGQVLRLEWSDGAAQVRVEREG